MKHLVLVVLAAASVHALGQPAPDRVFERFWNARTIEDRQSAGDAVARSGISVDEAVARLRQGRRYSEDVARGVVRQTHRTRDGEFPYRLDVPTAYSPARRYRVRIQLHGGVGRPANDPRAASATAGIGQLAGDEQIYVLPSAWAEAPWWSDAQLASLPGILDAVKHSYNIDENRVVMSGVSDGGTGAFYIAMRDTTPYAAFLPLNGFAMILANPSLGLRESLYPHNLRNKPFFIVNGGRDPLYPTSLVDPYIRHFQQGGVTIDYRPQPEAGHNTAWWPEIKEAFETFVRAHPREPHPVRLTWSTDSPATGRAHWLVINSLRPPRVADPLPDLNDRVTGRESNFGVRTAGMRILSVSPASNAEALGLRPEDVVASINGRPLPSGLDLLEFLSLSKPGDPLTLEVTRPDNTSRMQLTGVYQPTLTDRVSPLFPRPRPSGRVDVERAGNTVKATTRGVASFTLLLSPDAFDLARPIVVEADGLVVFDGRVTQQVDTLMKWAARDNDRTMLYTAELQITIP
jgi:poly(3-hydroxybutyrate) depolymerase